MRSSVIWCWGRAAVHEVSVSNSIWFPLSFFPSELLWTGGGAAPVMRKCSGKMLMVLPQSLSSCFSSSFSLAVSTHRSEPKTGRMEHKNFCRNSCNFNRFTLFLCYYELSVFMFHSLLVPLSSCSSSSPLWFWLLSVTYSDTLRMRACVCVGVTWWHSLWNGISQQLLC